jgi:hypothetical protein
VMKSHALRLFCEFMMHSVPLLGHDCKLHPLGRIRTKKRHQVWSVLQVDGAGSELLKVCDNQIQRLTRFVEIHRQIRGYHAHND